MSHSETISRGMVMVMKGVFVLEWRPLCRVLNQVLESRRLNLARNFARSMKIWLGERIQLLEGHSPAFYPFHLLSYSTTKVPAYSMRSSADSMNNRPAESVQHFV